MMRRPHAGNRDLLLDHGLELFRQRGYGATGVAEITAAAGVPKGSFYNYFASKEEFALEVLKRYQDGACGHLTALLGDRGRSPLARIEALFVAMGDDAAANEFAGGCLAGRLAQEVAGEVPAFREPLDRGFRCLQDILGGVLREARDRGELADDDDPDALAEFLWNAWQGALQRAKAAHSDRPLANFRQTVFGRLLRRPPQAGAA